MSTMRNARSLLLVIGCSVAAATCASQQDQLKFSHKVHVEGEGTECSQCHGEVAEAQDFTRFLPKEETCMECHDDEAKNCGFCHTQPKKPGPAMSSTPQGITFSHLAHVKRELKDPESPESACAGCHASAKSAELPRTIASRTERRDRCMNCHRTQDPSNIQCTQCHTDFVEVSGEPFDRFSHKGNFSETHGRLAVGNEAVCAHCHREETCQRCHSLGAAMRPSLMLSEGVARRSPHRGDVRTNHAIEARMDSDRCYSCHKPQTCTDCHREQNVAAAGSATLGSHPAGWMRKGSHDFHGPAARRNISSCATCHDRGRDTSCIACHKVGGSGGSPHDAGWARSADRDDSRVCRWCH